MRRTLIFYPPRSMQGVRKVGSTIRPIEVFRTLQLGAFPAPPITRKFLEVHFSKDLLERNITQTKLQALETQSCNILLRQLFQQKFLSVPCRIITFDAEFTGIPNFTSEGPSEDIIELGAFCPVRGKVFSRLVKTEKNIPPAVVKLTGITNELLHNEGVSFEEAWRDFVEFIETDDWVQLIPQAEIDASVTNGSTPASSCTKNNETDDKENDKKKKDNNEQKKPNMEKDNEKQKEKKRENKNTKTTSIINTEAEKSVWYDPVDIVRIPDTLPQMTTSNSRQFKPKVLLLSHGGKLADIAMIEWALKKMGTSLPPHFKFGDTHNIIQDLHQRRPVTQDKHPPSFKLSELCQWLKTPVPPTTHRAGPDAVMTWQAVFHTLDRYGDESRTPHQQLVLRYFENDAVHLMNETDHPGSAAQTLQAMGEGNAVNDGIGGEVSATTVTEDDMSVLDLDLDSILS